MCFNKFYKFRYNLDVVSDTRITIQYYSSNHVINNNSTKQISWRNVPRFNCRQKLKYQLYPFIQSRLSITHLKLLLIYIEYFIWNWNVQWFNTAHDFKPIHIAFIIAALHGIYYHVTLLLCDRLGYLKITYGYIG